MHLWDLLIPQMEIQLNLKRQSRTVPKVSAYAHHYGAYDFNAHPLAPLGMAVEYYVKPATRASFGMSAVSGWYVGSSLEHYRYHRCWITETKEIRTGNTVFFKHKYLTMPTITPADALLTATKDLQEALKGDIPKSQYNKGMVDKFIEILNAKAKTYQIDKILDQRMRTKAAQSQRVGADTNEDEDMCLAKKISKRHHQNQTHGQPIRDHVWGRDSALARKKSS